MAGDWKRDIVAAISGQKFLLFAILGFILILLGILDGVPREGWTAISESWRFVAIGIGIVLIVAGTVVSIFDERTTRRLPKIKDYDIKIENPKDADSVSEVSVRGTIKKAIPGGYSLRVLRIHPSAGTFVPIGEARIDIAKGTWMTDDCKIWGEPKEKWAIGVYLVGRDGNILLNYYTQAARINNDITALRNLTKNKQQYLLPLQQRTSDMIECARVKVFRS